MDIYKIIINADHATHRGNKTESYSIRSQTQEGAIIVALAKWLCDELRLDCAYIQERKEIPQEDVQGYLETLRFDDITITIGADNQAVDMAEMICEEGTVEFVFEEWEGAIQEISSVEDLEELILEEVLREVQKKYPDASINRESVWIPGSICDVGLYIKRGKLYVALSPNGSEEIGELDLANPKFPTNVIRGVLGMVENFVKNDRILGRL